LGGLVGKGAIYDALNGKSGFGKNNTNIPD